MSDAPKIEQSVVAVDAPKLADPVPASEATPALVEDITAETTTASAAVTESAAVVEDKKDDEAEPVKEEKPEPKEIHQGTLSKNAGGLLSYVTQLYSNCEYYCKSARLTTIPVSSSSSVSSTSRTRPSPRRT